MKHLLILIVCFLFVYCNKPINQKQADIDNINNFVLTIENESNSFQTKEFNISDIIKSTDGSSLIAYYKDTTLQKLNVTILGEMGHSQEDYYFRNDSIQLVYKLEVALDKPFGTQVSKKETWYFFKDGKLFSATDSSKTILEITPEIQDQANTLLTSQQKYLDVTKKKPTVYVRSDYSFALSNLPEGVVCEENEQDSSDVDLTIIVYNADRQKVGQITIIPWCAASQLAIGDSEFLIDGEPAHKQSKEEIWNEKAVIHYAFENIDIIVNASIREDFTEWFEKNFHFIIG